MIKINGIGISGVKNNLMQYKPAFSAQMTEPLKQNNTVPDALPTYNVKVPISYTSTGEVNLPYDYKAHCYKLANGQKVIIIPKEGETVLQTFVKTGSMNEPDNIRGISHYIEHNLFNGSDGIEAGGFYHAIDKMGAYANASTSLTTTKYYISSNLLNDDDLENQIKLQASMLESPKFAYNMLEKEKGIINSEINMIMDIPNSIITNETIRKLYNIKSSSNDLIGGTTNNITNLTREDVLDYYNNNYYPANMVTVITGEVEPEQTIKLIAKYFSGQNKNTHARKVEDLQPIDKTVRQDIISNNSPATLITLGFDGPKNLNTKDTIYTKALAQLLTMPTIGRLNAALKPLNTSAVVNFEKMTSENNSNIAILLECSTAEENSEKVLKRIFEQLQKIVTNPPTDDEIEIVKKIMLENNAIIFENSQYINDIVGTAFLNDNLSQITDYDNIIKSMTKEDLVNIAKKYLDLNKTVVTVLHSKDANIDNINKNYQKAIAFTGKNIKQGINPGNVNKYILQNNYEIITNDIRTDKTVINMKYNTPQIPKDIKPALSVVVQHMLNSGTINKDEINFEQELKKHGTSISVDCLVNGINIYTSCAPEDAEFALKRMKEILQSPRFNEEALNTAKSEIKDYYSLQENDAFSNLFKELFPNNAHGWDKDDVLNSIDSVTLDDVRNFYNEILNTSQGHLTISAPFSKNPELKNTLFNEVSQLQKVKPAEYYMNQIYQPIEKTKVLTGVHNKNQAHICEAFKFKINGNIKDDVTIDLLNTILGGNSSSRLFTDLREKQQLAYRVNSKVVSYDNTGVLNMFIATTTKETDTGEEKFENIEKSIRGFNKHIEKLKTEKVSEEELENAKMYLKNTILSQIETSACKTDILSHDLTSAYGPLSVNEKLKLIDTITTDDIYNAANYVFSQKPTYSIFATENSLKANENLFKTLELN